MQIRESQKSPDLLPISKSPNRQIHATPVEIHAATPPQFTVKWARSEHRTELSTNEALPQTVEHVGIYADLSVGLRLGLVSLYVVLPRLRRGVALTEKS
jgi:hypothetical protein